MMRNIVLAALPFVVVAPAVAQDPPSPVPVDTPTTKAQQASPRLKKGDVAPPFVVEDKDGNKVRLEDFARKIVIVDVSATWCGPCQAAMPNNDRIYRKYADQGVELLAVCANDTREKYLDWATRNATNWKFRLLFDPAGKDGWNDSVFCKDYGVSGWPTMFVIGRDGNIVETIGGGGPGEDYRIEYALARAGAKVDLASLPPEPVRDPSAPKSIPMVSKTPAMARGATPLVPEKFGSVAQGALVPDFTLEDKDGKAVTLASLKGRRVLLHFHTGNGPQPWIEGLVKSYADQNLATLCVFAATEKDAFTRWVADQPAPSFLVAWDKAGKAWAEGASNTVFNVGMYPATAIIDADGKLVSGTIGMGDRIAVMVKAMLAKAGVKLTTDDQAAVTAAEAARKPAKGEGGK